MSKWLVSAVIVMFLIASGVIVTLVSVISQSNSTSTNSNNVFSIVSKSNDPESFSDNESLDGSAIVDQVAKEYDESKVDAEELNRWYMELIHLHLDEIGLLKYIEGGKLNVANIETVESQLNPDTFEFTYYLEGRLTNEFNTLTDNEQLDLLDGFVYTNRLEYYWGHKFDTMTFNLTSNSDTYTIQYNEPVLKNGESFALQLEDPWGDIKAKMEPLYEESEFVPTHKEFDVYEYMQEQYLTYSEPQVTEMAAEKFGISVEEAYQIYEDMEEWYFEQNQ